MNKEVTHRSQPLSVDQLLSMVEDLKKRTDIPPIEKLSYWSVLLKELSALQEKDDSTDSH